VALARWITTIGRARCPPTIANGNDEVRIVHLIKLTLDLHTFGKPPEEFWYAQGCPSSSQVQLLQLKDVRQTPGSARRQASLHNAS
jgi:hypothetical protein